MFFLNSVAFSMIQERLTIWPLVLLPFLNPVCTSGNSGTKTCSKAKLFVMSLNSLVQEGAVPPQVYKAPRCQGIIKYQTLKKKTWLIYRHRWVIPVHEERKIVSLQTVLEKRRGKATKFILWSWNNLETQSEVEENKPLISWAQMQNKLSAKMITLGNY